jgi:hypothetical protein
MNNPLDEHWILTHTGRKFHYLDPKPEEICIEDIIHHLSLLCRFTGACHNFYSVAEHSIRVSRIVPKELRLSALLHDAAEAYLNDISRPVKYSHKLDETEHKILDVIAKKFNIEPHHPEVKKADDILLATERRDLMIHTNDKWSNLVEPLEERIIPVPHVNVVKTTFWYIYNKCLELTNAKA